MKKILIISSLLTLGIASNLRAQFTQLELFSGFHKTDVTVLASHTINKSLTLSITTLAFLQKFKEIGLQPTLFWNINEHIAVGPSLYYNSFAGYSERLSAKLTLKNSRLLFVLIPTVAHSEQTKASYA